MGSLFLKDFQTSKKEIIIVDYNPEIIASLIKKKIPCIYGDCINKEVLEKVNLKNAEMMISTVANPEDNLLLIKKTKSLNSKIPVIVTADRISEALELYDAGADYVILPQIIGAQKAFEIIQSVKNNKDKLMGLKKGHIQYLNSIHRILY
jgi:voltage-gated potassium channel Kch